MKSLVNGKKNTLLTMRMGVECIWANRRRLKIAFVFVLGMEGRMTAFGDVFEYADIRLAVFGDSGN